MDADLRIWLRAPLAVRAARVAAREALAEDQALRELEERQASECRRYREIYNIDITDLSRYHIIVDTGIWSAAEIVDALLLLSRRFELSARPCPDGPPGKAPGP